MTGGTIFQNINDFTAKLTKLRDQRSELKGAIASEEKLAQSIVTELATEKFRNIDTRYKEKLIEVKTNTMANSDLDAYHKALDKALMHFHSIKMKVFTCPCQNVHFSIVFAAF